MNPVREQLFATCVDAATRYLPGLFTLSAPTGSAKTLAMLAFALHHARQHGLRRIVLVMPFLNIIEQTARIYRELFSPEHGFDPNTVVEHHSLADDRELDGADERVTASSMCSGCWRKTGMPPSSSRPVSSAWNP